MSKFDVDLKARPIQTVGETDACGDKGLIIDHVDYLFVALCDGAGHGLKAAEASKIAIDFIKTHHELPLDKQFELLHQALRSTRGGAINLARIDKATMIMSFAGIGNVGTRLFRDKNTKLLTRDGVVGSQMTNPRVLTKELKEGDILIFYSDGIRDRIDASDFPTFQALTAEEITRITIDYLSKPLDDASCLTIKVNYD